MNFYGLRTEFDRINRTLADTDFASYRDDWLNMGWQRISELFVIPGLKRRVSIDSVADTQYYPFPLDYSGTEVFLWYKNSTSGTPRRLDPVTEEVMALIYEHRSGNMGGVYYYDWSYNVGSDYASRTCTLTNNSATVLCAAAAALDVDRWIRFDPWTTGTTTYNPGDYGYLITAVTAGVSYTLDRAYRGPAGSTTGRVTPSEQGQFIVYGIPDTAITDAFTLEYYARPRRLYNDADVPEWSNMGLAIVYMSVSLGYDFIQHPEAAKVWFGRAAAQVNNLKQRRERTKTLVSDLTIGSVSGRRTGPYGVISGTRRYLSRR